MWLPSKVLRRAVRRMRKIVLGRNGARHFRFLFDSWTALSSIDLAARVVDVEFFRGGVVPQPLPVEQFKSILVVAPHQDDETIGAGGTMLIANKAGASVDVLYVTDGMQRNLPCTPEESIRIRRAEAEKACAVAGAKLHSLDISNIRPAPTVEHVDQLIAVIDRIRPDVLLVPWLLDAPPKHRMVNHLLLLANRRARLPECEVWGYQVHSGIIPNGYVDITAVMPEKTKMLEAFESQNMHSQCYEHLSAGLSAWNSRYLPSEIGNVKRRYAEIFFSVPLSEHLQLTERFYLRDLEQTYRGSNAVIDGMRRLQMELS